MKRALAVTPLIGPACLATVLGALIALGCSGALAQGPEMEQKLIAIKQAQTLNKQKLAQYTWQETQTISIKGDVKDTKVYQVQVGPDGKQQKTEIGDQQAQSGGRQGRVKERVVAKKKEEYQQYGEDIGALAKQYTSPNPEALMQAKQQGNISLQLGGNGTVNLVIKNYMKPNDSMTMTIDGQTKSPVSVQVSSYLSDPKDAVKISANFARLGDGTNHVANTTIDGVSKQLTVNQQNSNYQLR